jgi:hypothetical protein
MADAPKLGHRHRGGLGAPPPVEKSRIDLTASPQREQGLRAEGITNAVDPPIEAGRVPPVRLDGRSMRRSGRTLQFATRVSPAFDERIRQIALRDGMLLVEVLEHALDAYEQCKTVKR